MLPGLPQLRPLLTRLLLVAVSAAAALAVVELALRVREPAAAGDLAEGLRRSARAEPRDERGRTSLIGLVQPSPHPDLVYELKPGLAATFRTRPLRTNSHGMRGREVAVAKPPGTFRVAGLGDSVMFCWGVGEGEPYLQVLEPRLSLAHPERRYECLSFAVPGYNAAMEAAAFEHRAAAFDPDVVVVHFVRNDLGLPHFMQPPLPAGLRVAALLRETFGAGAGGGSGLLAHHDTAESQARRAEARQQYQHMVGEEGYRQAMARLAGATRERGVPVILLALERGRRGDAPARAAARAHGFRYLDATPVFERYAAAHGLDESAWRGVFTIPGDGHPTPLGHALYAEALLAELERGLLPGSPTAARPPR